MGKHVDLWTRMPHSGIQISCQSSKFENFHLRFIYRISHHIAIKANPPKWICPIENCRYAIKAKMSDLSQVLEVDDILRLLKISTGYSKYVVHALHDAAWHEIIPGSNRSQNPAQYYVQTCPVFWAWSLFLSYTIRQQILLKVYEFSRIELYFSVQQDWHKYWLYNPRSRIE